MTALEIAMAGYLAFGLTTGDYYEAITKHSGLQVMHADGAVTLRLRARVSGGFSRSRGGRSGNSPLPVRGLVDGACCVSKDYRQLACGEVGRTDALVVEVEAVNIHNRSHLFLSKSERRPVGGAPAPVRRSYSGVRWRKLYQIPLSETKGQISEN